MVFLDHMLAWPRGGFIGVDMFFVISGFVITAGLIRSYLSSGHISARDFYVRRTKRIIPAATLVLIVTVAVSYLIFSSQRAASIFGNAIAAFFFVSNWNFAAVGTDYFQQDAAVSPLQHYWSLSVEEQFYFVWPWLLLGLLVLFARGQKMSEGRTRAVAGATIGVVVVASFGWAMIQSTTSPTVAYFSTLTRGWELGVGALLAIISPLFLRMPGALRTALAYAGVAGMIASCFVISPETTWPAPWALLPVMSTAVAILSGIGSEARFIGPITNPIAVYIGDISYSLYLWHFPVIVFAKALFPDAGVWVYLGIAVAGFGLATAAYHAIEKPLWKSPLWVTPGHHAWRDWRQAFSSEARNGGLIGLGVATAVLTVLALTSVAPASPASIAAYTPKPFGTNASGTPTPQTQLDPVAQGIVEAVSARTWPADLTPSLDNVGTEGKPDEDNLRCSDPNADTCAFGPADGPEMLVYGDSLGNTLLPTVRAAYADTYHVRGLTQQSCAITDLNVRWDSDDQRDKCLATRSTIREVVAERKPAVVFVIQNYAWSENLASKATGAAMTREWTAAATNLQNDLTQAGAGRVIFVTPPPRAASIAECALRNSTPSSCLTQILPYYEPIRAAEKAAVKAQLDETDMFCTVDGKCPALNGNILVRHDTVHPTKQYAAFIANDWKARAQPLLQN